jgi:transposase-like protein
MTNKNKYANRSKISEAKFRQFVKLFCLDLDAKQITELTNLNRNTVNRYLKGLRQRIASHCEEASPMNGQIEVDESFFGAKRAGKRGRGAYGKTIVFGLFKRNGKVYTEIVPDCASRTLQSIIRGRVSIDSVIHSDKWRGYDGLVDVGYEKHLRVDHGQGEYVSHTSHINGIEGFWGFAKTRLVKFHGIAESHFYLHLKECEFRFNHRSEDMYLALLKIIRNNPLF